MRKYVMIGVCIVIGAIIFLYNGRYNVKEDALEANIFEFINRGRSNDLLEINIEKSTDIGNRRIVCFTYDEGLLGEAMLKKGINHRFKIEWIGQGTNLYRYRVREFGNKNYLTVIGRNYDLQITNIIAIFDNETYEIKVPQQDFFIIYCEVEGNNIKYPELRLLDGSHNDITDHIYKTYSTITVKNNVDSEISKYVINNKGTGWEVNQCVIEINSNGEIVDFSGKLVLNESFKMFDLEIFQLDGQIRNSIYNDSYSLVDGVVISTNFSDSDLEDESFDYNEPFYAEVRFEKKENQLETVAVEVVRME